MRIALFDYERHRIIMESSFTFEGKDYLFFPEGVNYYHLYRSSRKLNSFAELAYVAEKFIYLNPDFDVDKMKSLFFAVSDRESGHIVRTYTPSRVDEMVDRVVGERMTPFCPRLRKVIFNPSKYLSKEDKNSIVAKLIHTKDKPSEDDIDEVIQELWLNKEKITIRRVAKELDTTFYLVRWYFTDDKMEYIRSVNQEIKREAMIAKAIEIIDALTDNGNKLKMRKLKQLSSIRDYQLLKEAVNRYHLDG
jgi:hypothetical protein